MGELVIDMQALIRAIVDLSRISGETDSHIGRKLHTPSEIHLRVQKGSLKWSRKTGQCDKVYSMKRKEYANDH